jgi:hypothetical protein
MPRDPNLQGMNRVESQFQRQKIGGILMDSCIGLASFM